jgi:hypothetical protein
MTTRRTRRIAIAVVALVLAAAAYRYFGTHRVPAGQPALVTIEAGSIDSLRRDFNRASNDTRIIVLLSPT